MVVWGLFELDSFRFFDLFKSSRFIRFSRVVADCYFRKLLIRFIRQSGFLVFCVCFRIGYNKSDECRLCYTVYDNCALFRRNKSISHPLLNIDAIVSH